MTRTPDLPPLPATASIAEALTLWDADRSAYTREAIRTDELREAVTECLR